MCSLASLAYLPEQSDQTQKKREAIEYVMTLTGKSIGKEVVVTAYEHLVYEIETGNPVSVLYLSVAVLDIILTAGKVPHEISPVHEVDLISQEELDILELCGNCNLDVASALVIGNGTSLYASAP